MVGRTPRPSSWSRSQRRATIDLTPARKRVIVSFRPLMSIASCILEPGGSSRKQVGGFKSLSAIKLRWRLKRYIDPIGVGSLVFMVFTKLATVLKPSACHHETPAHLFS